MLILTNAFSDLQLFITCSLQHFFCNVNVGVLSWWNISALVPHLWVSFWAKGNNKYIWISTIFIVLNSVFPTAGTYMEQCCCQESKHLLLNLIPLLAAHLEYSLPFSAMALELLQFQKTADWLLLEHRERLIIVLFNLLVCFFFFFTNPKYLKNKSRNNIFRVKCNPVLKSPYFKNSFLSFSLLKTARQRKR